MSIKESRSGSREWVNGLGAGIAGLAFAAALVGFGIEVFAFRHAVEKWARRDLKTQAELAAASMDEPLRTQDFRRLDDLQRTLAAKEMILRVRSARGGWIYRGGYEGKVVEEEAAAGEYLVGVAVRATQVYAPFYRALRGFALAALVGTAGMALFFFVLYRQRVKIRELARLERFRREFIADVSHEIRTPLTGITGAAEMLEESSPLAKMIRREAGRLNELVQRILDLSRLEREEGAVDRAEFDIGELVRGIGERYRVVVNGAEERVIYRGDARRLEEAIGNLVANAVRHSGSKEIFLSLQKTGERLEIAVEDHGVGIPAEHRARIFERFYRVDPARAAESGGAGLGLSIAQRIAQLHGGEIKYQAVEPHGSRLVLTLP